MSSLRNPISLLSKIFVLICVGSTSSAWAQLSILSQGNRQVKWRESQLLSLEAQLSETGVGQSLKLELEAQVKWLKAWRPGTLTAEPLWSLSSKVGALEEPVVDPSGVAGALRDRLLGNGARPTAEDTRALQLMLEKHAEDVGVRQLHLHWLDQIQYRKAYPTEIADAALRLAGMFEQMDTDESRLALAHCLYRCGRALTYRELPDVVDTMPIEDPEKLEAQLIGVYRHLKELVPEDRSEFILLDVRMLRRDNWNGRALALLEEYGSQLEKQWFLKKRRDVLRDLGWSDAADEAAGLYAKHFPDEVESDV